MYVLSKNASDNTVTLCEASALFADTLDAEDFNWIACDGLCRPMRVKAKIRYAQTPQWAIATQTSVSTARIEFEKPQRAISKGQAVVLYDGDIVVGGGTIS